MFSNIPEKYLKVIARIQRLKSKERYVGAFVFGSVARGDVGVDSDLDVIVVVATDNECLSISQPVIDGIKLDLSFVSMKQLQDRENHDHSGKIPMLAEAVVLFDTTGELARFKTEMEHKRREPYTEEERPHVQFLINHTESKICYGLMNDVDTAKLCLQKGWRHLIDVHYKIQGRWNVSDKRLVRDLQEWDMGFLDMVRGFLRENDPEKQYDLWKDAATYIFGPWGGRQETKGENCGCERCKKDIEVLRELE